MCLIVTIGAIMKITEQWLTERNACEPGVDWFTSQSANEPGKILNKLTSEERYDWAIWLVIELMFAIYCAREVLPIFEEYCTDSSPRLAIEAAEAYLRNPCEEAARAADAAADAADDAAAHTADDAAAHAAAEAAWAAYAAARAAEAAWAAARAAAYAAYDARAAAYDARAAAYATYATYAADAKQFQMKIITYARETLKL
jgi:hypothetical protein